MKPRMFIGSSAEQLPYAEAIQSNLEYNVQSTIWNQGVFVPSKTALECLQEQGGKFDFALFVFKPDDVVRLRKKTFDAVRDNVLFELGLFIGFLKRDRNFCLTPARSASELRVASDLIGFTPITFTDDPLEKNKRALLGPACNELRRAIENIWMDSFLAGEWEQQWFVENSKNFKKKNPGKATVLHMGNQFNAVIDSRGQKFKVNGTVERNMYITGTWADVLDGASYFGSFQLAISPRHDKLTGKWIGFDSRNRIQSGNWEWNKVKK